MADAAYAAKVKGPKDRKTKKTGERRRTLRSAAPTAIPAAMRSAVPPGDGQPLPPWLADSMASRLGHDFSRVRIHSSPTAAVYADAFDANAYTLGQHIVFNAKNFSPGTGDGQRLIAHELAHVVQQQRGGSPPELSADASHERAADRAADRIAMGASQVAVGGSTGVGIARDEKDKKNGPKPPPKQLTAGSQEPKQLPPGPVTVDQIMADPDASKRVHQVAAGTAGSVKDITNTQGAIFEEMMNMEINRRIKYGSNVKGMLPKDVDPTKIRFVDPATDPNKLAPGEAMFITGDRIHGMVDGKKVKLSDGMILLREKEGIRVVTAFEGKSGQRRASDLHRTESGKEALKPDDKKELGQVKRETNKGKVIESEMGGQVRKTVERLSPHADDDATDILVDGKRVSVRASPKTTRYLGVVPKDVDIKASEKQLTEKEGINFRTMKLESSEGDIKVAASKVVEKAQAGKPWPMPASSKKSDDPSSDSGAAKPPKAGKKSAAMKPPAAKKPDPAKKTAGTKKATAAQKPATPKKPAAPKKQAAKKSTAAVETKKSATKPPASVPGDAADKKTAQPAKPNTVAPRKAPDTGPKPKAVAKPPANPTASQSSAAKPPAATAKKATAPPAKAHKPAVVAAPKAKPTATSASPPKPAATAKLPPIQKQAPTKAAPAALPKATVSAPKNILSKINNSRAMATAKSMAIGAAFDILDAWVEQKNIERSHNKDMKEKVEPAIESGIAALGDQYMAAQVKSTGKVYAVVTLETSMMTNENRLTIFNENYGGGVMVTNLYLGTDVVDVRIADKAEQGESSSEEGFERVAYKYTITKQKVTYSVELDRVPFDELLEYGAAKELPLDALRAEAQRQIADTEDVENRSVDLNQMAAKREAWTKRLNTLDAYQADISKRQADRNAFAKVMQANQASKDKQAQDKLDRDKLDRVLAADKEKASQKPPAGIPGFIPPGQSSASSAPLKIGPFDASPEVTPGERGDLIASKYEQEKEKWVVAAEKIKSSYHAGKLTNEQFREIRERRDRWVAGLNRYAEAMSKVPEMKSGAGRMKALQDWLANDGHNAIMNF